MKKVVFSFFAAFCALTSLQAQSILTGANMNPVPGDIFYGHQVDTNVNMGAAGPNVTWNFSAITEIGLDTTSILACDSTPYCATFPGSNIAEYNAGDYIYADASSTSLAILGIRATGLSIFFTTPWKTMNYPTTYNSVYVDTAVGTIPSYHIYHTEIDSFICDGYGTLILPTGTDTGVLRVHMIANATDSGMGSVTVGRTESYYWFMPGFHNSVFSIDYDTAGSPTGQSYVVDAEYWVKNRNTTSVKEVNNSLSSFRLFPNPTSDELHISFDTQNAAETNIYITDLVGKTVGTIDNASVTTGKNDIIYNTGSMASGLYLVHLNCNGVTMTQKVTVVR